MLKKNIKKLQCAVSDGDLSCLLNINSSTFNLLTVLYNEGYIVGYQIEQKKLKNGKHFKGIRVMLSLINKDLEIFESLKKIKTIQPIFKSMSAQQIYRLINKKKLFLGMYLISTSYGVLSHMKALELNEGGLVLCKII